MDFWDFQESQDGSDVINCVIRMWWSIDQRRYWSSDTPNKLHELRTTPTSTRTRTVHYHLPRLVIVRYPLSPTLLCVEGRPAQRGRKTLRHHWLWGGALSRGSVLSRESTTWRGPDWEPSYRWVKAYEWVRLHVPAVIVPANCTQMGDQSFSLRVTAPHQNPYFLFQNPLADELFCIIFVKT